MSICLFCIHYWSHLTCCWCLTNPKQRRPVNGKQRQVPDALTIVKLRSGAYIYRKNIKKIFFGGGASEKNLLRCDPYYLGLDLTCLSTKLPSISWLSPLNISYYGQHFFGIHIVVTPHWEFGDLCFPHILVAQGGSRRFEPKTYLPAGRLAQPLSYTYSTAKLTTDSG